VNQWWSIHRDFIEEACRQPGFKFEILFLVESDDSVIEVPTIMNCLCSTFFESVGKRLRYLTSWLNSDSVFLPLACDDYLVACDFTGLAELFCPRDVVGVVPLTYWDTIGGEIAASSDLSLEEDDALARISKYLTPPFPGENSLFWGCFKGGAYRSAIQRLAIVDAEQVHAWDWLFMAELLSRGKFASGKNILIKVREREPISKYHAEVASSRMISLEQNPLYSTLKAFEKLFFISDFRVELLSWLIIKFEEQRSLGLINNFSELDIERIRRDFDSTFGGRS
jgi:hypothetical protein